MNIKHYLIVLGFFLPITLIGQDQIFKKDQTSIAVNIINWDQDNIRYHALHPQDSLLHVLSTWYVDSIIFARGETIRFEKELVLPEGYKLLNSRNVFGVGLVDPFLYTNLRFTYERYLGEGKISLFIPVSIGLNKSTSWYKEKATSIHVGAGINFHVPAKRISRFYNVGLGLRFGAYREREYPEIGEPYYIEDSYYFGLINYHSVNIPLGRVLLVPGVDIHLLGHYEGKFRFLPVGWDFWPVFRLDLVYPF